MNLRSKNERVKNNLDTKNQINERMMKSQADMNQLNEQSHQSKRKQHDLDIQRKVNHPSKEHNRIKDLLAIIVVR